MRRTWLTFGLAAVVLVGCSGGPGGGATATPVASPMHVVLDGNNLCDLLTAADFVAVGISGADAPTENNTDNEFYCVYAGRSSATGGIEMDAFVLDDPAELDVSYESVVPANDPQDVTSQVAGAQQATVGTHVSGGPEFGQIGVRSGNFAFGIGVPPTGDWKNQLIQLARTVLRRAAEL